jgi:flagellar basal body L-ring protein FlgH
MAEIIERYPNGNYKIRGTKRVLYKNGTPRLVNLVGVVRGSDIAEDDTVPSGKLYEYRLEAVR